MLKEIEIWYNSPSLRRSPFILFGARQTGKSTMLLEFAKQTKREAINLNFWKDENDTLKNLFSKNTSAKTILSKLEILLEKKIDEDRNILILDEIQEAPSAYALFKSFKEDTHLPVMATGSYLKLFLKHNNDIEIPIGCTHEKLLTPLTFSEYLYNANPKLFEIYIKFDHQSQIDDFYHNSFLKAYYDYLFTGGMPEAVSIFIEHKNNSLLDATTLTRTIQNQILTGYKNDFLKIASSNKYPHIGVEKIARLFDLIPKELMKFHELDTPVQRFKFSSLGTNQKFSKVSNIFEYLSLSGVIIKSHVIKKISSPLDNLSEHSAFKCFFFDVGLLHSALKIPYMAITQNQLSSYKGPIAENFVAQELFHATKEDLHSWKPNNYQEVEFLHIPSADDLTAIEVKSSKNALPSKSLMHFLNLYPKAKGIKFSPKNFGNNERFVTIPIYMVEKVLGTSTI